MSLNRIKKGFTNRVMQTINERKGWKTNRNIIVIESDDWGSIRMPDIKTYEQTLKMGIRVDRCHYCRNDSLASADDFSALYDVLRKYKDINGKHPIITANTIMANPDFQKIREDDFQQYHFELFTETLKKYSHRDFTLWKEGMVEEMFVPQLHGREHLNVERWMGALNRNSKEVHFAFNNYFFGISKSISNENNPSFMAALDYDNENGKTIAVEATKQAVLLFENVFGFKSKTFIAPNYFWDENIETELNNNNIKFLQGGFIQNMPKGNNKFRYLGENNLLNQVYLTRNVTFEPSSDINKDWLSSTLKEIDTSFKFNKPAIICSHRVNFIGSIFEENRTKNLKLLNSLLTEVSNRWPSVEFMSSAQLSKLIQE